jgi:phosphoglycerol transferase MdoB-like AlkP superfamily enzyme
MKRAIRLGVLYFAAVFAAGFLLGALRVGFVVPRFGPLIAVLIELPVILTAAWLICGRLLGRQPLTVAQRLVIGGTAFGLLMLAELGLSVLLAGRSPAQHWALYRQLPEQLGLAGQLLFAAFPLLRGRNRH